MPYLLLDGGGSGIASYPQSKIHLLPITNQEARTARARIISIPFLVYFVVHSLKFIPPNGHPRKADDESETCTSGWV